MQAKRLVVLLMVSGLYVSQLWAQDRMLLHRVNRPNTVIEIALFRPIAVKLHDRTGLIVGRLVQTRSQDSSLWVLASRAFDPLPGYEASDQWAPRRISLHEIEYLVLPPTQVGTDWREVFNQVSLIMGGMLIGGSTTQTLATGRAPHFSTILVATGILATGFIAKYGPRRRYVLGTKWRLAWYPAPSNENLTRN